MLFEDPVVVVADHGPDYVNDVVQVIAQPGYGTR
jgi:hypothetical protein